MKVNILWDFDGTLVDSYRVFVRMFKRVVEEHIHEDEIMKHLKISFTHAVKYYGLSQRQIDQILEMERSVHPSEYQPFPRVEEVLQRAHRNCIVTHNSKEEVLRILKYYGWEDGFLKKPNPESYVHMQKKYAINFVVGDRELDIIPATKLGITTCSFQNEAIPDADYYIDSYHQLLHILKEKSMQI
ncbi:HAD-IA family hydrolase [Bacillus multifaciens]|uniref:HAD-IA family hydrolase n=1 Tax=Bacillus multifaciens TaxID=3068506 RepID=UPI0027413590|nr:HAD-IA family hydrolase [Bacillus sp. WLY-B-L8]MDP7979438.1 HAD-IA family hydrolase [Bacillus sp. WLY-B-L8]